METATLEAPVHVQPEVPAPVAEPEPSISELLERHLDPNQQKKIAVDNLNSIKFLVAPDGKRAVSLKELPSDTHKQIVEESLRQILGHRAEDAPYLPAQDGLAETLGLSSASNFVEINAPAHIKRLAEAGVKDFADAMDISQTTHAARVR